MSGIHQDISQCQQYQHKVNQLQHIKQKLDRSEINHWMLESRRFSWYVLWLALYFLTYIIWKTKIKPITQKISSGYQTSRMLELLYKTLHIWNQSNIITSSYEICLPLGQRQTTPYAHSTLTNELITNSIMWQNLLGNLENRPIKIINLITINQIAK